MADRYPCAVPHVGLSVPDLERMFNILNNTNFSPQTLIIFDGTGKLIPNVGQPHAPTANQSRQIQLGLRLLF